MKNTLNQIYLALFLAFISQGIHAQFDDIYYDPDKDQQVPYSNQRNQDVPDKDEYSHGKEKHLNANDSDYDDAYSEWDDQDYYYASRIKRFHRPYHGFDYYSPCYADYYFYDNYEYSDPWFFDRDIYSTRWYYYDSYRWNRWNSYRYYSRPYWSYWDWCLGWNPYSYSYGYGYWPYRYDYGNPYYYNHGRRHSDWDWNSGDRNPKGQYYGSRRFGATQTSNRGPVRLYNPDPEILKALPGKSREESPKRESGRKPIRSSEGEGAGRDHNDKPERTDQPRPKPRLYMDDSNYNPVNPESANPPGSPRTDRERSPREMPDSEKYREDRDKRSWFTPHRSIRPEGNPDRESGRDRTLSPSNDTYRQDRESKRTKETGGFFDKIMGRQERSESGSNSNNHTDKSGSTKSSGGGRKSPR